MWGGERERVVVVVVVVGADRGGASEMGFADRVSEWE